MGSLVILQSAVNALLVVTASFMQAAPPSAEGCPGCTCFLQDSISWTLGFAIPAVAMALALLLFLAGSSRYRHIPATESPMARVVKVVWAALQNRWGPEPVVIWGAHVSRLWSAASVLCASYRTVQSCCCGGSCCCV